MPLASDVTTGGGPRKSILDKIAAEVAARGPRMGANGVPDTATALQSLAPENDGPMFRPDADISGGAVHNDTYYPELLGRVYADTPIRGTMFGRQFRDNGVLGGEDPAAPGEFTGNVTDDIDLYYDGEGKNYWGKSYLLDPTAGRRGGRDTSPRSQGISGPGDPGVLAEVLAASKKTPARYGTDAVRAENAPRVKESPIGRAPGTSGYMDLVFDTKVTAENPYDYEVQTQPGERPQTSLTEDLRRQLSEDLKARQNGETQSTPYQRGPAPRGYSPDRPASPHLVDEAISQREQAEVARDMVKSDARAMRQGMRQGGRKQAVKAMTVEEYQALGPDQKAAIDLNTLLVEAVRADLAGTAKGKNPGGEEYDREVGKLFGADVAENQPYAPKTVELLDKLGYRDTDTKLNDFLKLRAAFTADDIDGLAVPDPDVAPDANLMTAAFSRDELQQSLVDSLQGARTDRDTRGGMLETQRSLLGTDKMLGFGKADMAGSPEEQLNDFFQRSFDALSQKEFVVDDGTVVSRDDILADVRGRLSEKEWEAFTAYLNVRSRESSQYELPLGTESDTPYLRPKQFRAKLDLNRQE